MCTVYLLFCLVTEKVYIGWSQHGVWERLKDHLKRARGNARKYHLHHAINHHGIDSFLIVELFTGRTIEEAKLLEREQIALYKANNPAFGYNLTPGGDGFDSATVSTNNQKRWASMTREERAAFGAKISRARLAEPPEERTSRSARAGRAWGAVIAAMSPQEYTVLRDALRASQAAIPAEVRLARATKGGAGAARMWDRLSPEEKAARMLRLRSGFLQYVVRESQEERAARIGKQRASRARTLLAHSRSTCRRGHPKSQFTYTSPNGKSRCRACNTLAHQRYYERKHGAPKRGARRSTCVHGHRWVTENIYTTPRGDKLCRLCRKNSYARSKESKKAAKAAQSAQIAPNNEALTRSA